MFGLFKYTNPTDKELDILSDLASDVAADIKEQLEITRNSELYRLGYSETYDKMCEQHFIAKNTADVCFLKQWPSNQCYNKSLKAMRIVYSQLQDLKKAQELAEKHNG